MSRRYLSQSEVAGALNRGKAVECFLGRCARSGKEGVRWLSISSSGDAVKLYIYESADIGSEEFCDIYEFGPLDEELEFEDPYFQLEFPDLPSLYVWLHEHELEATEKLLNQLMIQEEYLDYIRSGRGRGSA
ncbi:hypothetical protein I6M59_12225 [Shewanella algae]|nr:MULTISPECIES: hypothetical protein [Shewanella]MBO2595630.1 hypothetical protein [Shewanella algae]MBO2675500.1 hypothetical protein [Shewanella algae]MBO2692495.1 hypothetical protein [Shewanella algae]MCE9789958.1 hypothetical protein [Shewanella chilikensis]QTE89174.1 hypothetical protein JKK33_12150 [Shewanella algae]